MRGIRYERREGSAGARTGGVCVEILKYSSGESIVVVYTVVAIIIIILSHDQRKEDERKRPRVCTLGQEQRRFETPVS